MESLIAFIGRTHPLWVHLPIGFLLLGGLFYLLSGRERFAAFHTPALITLLLGTVASLLTAVTGYILSLDGTYDEELVGRHLNAALITTGLSMAWCYVVNRGTRKWIQHTAAVLTLSGLLLTGHFGGTLTHGEGYLTGTILEQVAPKFRKPLPDVQEAVLFTQVVEPILKEKCITCHGADKQKGKLRLDSREAILKGGEDGIVLLAGDPEKSELIKRILLPLRAKAHMPPRDHAQLEEGDAALLQWWVSSGASFDKKVRALAADGKTLAWLGDFGKAGSAEKSLSSAEELPGVTVPPAAPEQLAKLKELGIMAVPLAAHTPFLRVSCFAVGAFNDTVITALNAIKQQIVDLDLAVPSVSDSNLAAMMPMPNLMRLHLERSAITDKGLGSLKALKHLRYLNLSHTSVSFEGVKQLTGLIELRQMYLYRTRVGASDWPALHAALPMVEADSGGYQVHYLETDTQLVRSK